MNKYLKFFIYYSPRILSLIMFLFLVLFSLDVFEIATTFNELLLGLFIHNIPAIILLMLSIIAWKYDLVGMITFYGAALAYIILVSFNELDFFIKISWIMSLSLPFAVIGSLYLLSYRIKVRP
jgi:hypothetical protein